MQWRIENTRPCVINCFTQLCAHARERTFTFSPPSFWSVGFACIVKWDWLKHLGHYSPHCLANFCGLTSTKMSSRSSSLPCLPLGPLILWLLTLSLPTPTHMAHNSCCYQPFFLILSIYLGSESAPITNKIWLQWKSWITLQAYSLHSWHEK